VTYSNGLIVFVTISKSNVNYFCSNKDSLQTFIRERVEGIRRARYIPGHFLDYDLRIKDLCDHVDRYEESQSDSKNKRNSSNHNHINKSPDDDAQSGTPGSDTISTDEKGKLILG